MDLLTVHGRHPQDCTEDNCLRSGWTLPEFVAQCVLWALASLIYTFICSRLLPTLDFNGSPLYNWLSCLPVQLVAFPAVAAWCVAAYDGSFIEWLSAPWSVSRDAGAHLPAPHLRLHVQGPGPLPARREDGRHVLGAPPRVLDHHPSPSSRPRPASSSSRRRGYGVRRRGADDPSVVPGQRFYACRDDDAVFFTPSSGRGSGGDVASMA